GGREEGEKRAWVGGSELAIRYGDCIRRSRLPVQQSYFAEQLSFAQDVEHGLPAVFSRCRDFDTAVADRVEAGACIALFEDDVPASEDCGSSHRAQQAKILVRQWSKDWMCGKKRERPAVYFGCRSGGPTTADAGPTGRVLGDWTTGQGPATNVSTDRFVRAHSYPSQLQVAGL